MRSPMIAALALALLAAPAAQAQQQKKPKIALPPDSLYLVPVKTLEGQPADLKDHAGSVALVVNLASRCGKTPQYSGLEKLYGGLKDKGFVILGFPSNDFGGQEPGTAQEIREFCSSKYSVSFPIFEKCVVKEGKEQSPVYANLQKQSKQLPNWNFCKYLVGKNGKVIKFYKNSAEPDDAELLKDIQAALAMR
jgi:glutathione peroxidase